MDNYIMFFGLIFSGLVPEKFKWKSTHAKELSCPCYPTSPEKSLLKLRGHYRMAWIMAGGQQVEE